MLWYNYMCLLIWTVSSGEQCGPWASCLKSILQYMYWVYYSGWTRWCFQCYANRLGQTMLRNPVRFKISLTDNYNYLISLPLHGGLNDSTRRYKAITQQTISGNQLIQNWILLAYYCSYSIEFFSWMIWKNPTTWKN